MIEQWLELRPLDTLFFRGGEPMEAGETHEAGRPIFPPVPETLIGALRTAILAQKGIDPARIKALPEDEPLDEKWLPLWGTPKKSGFWVAGPLIKIDKAVLFSAPASWLYDADQSTNLRLKIYEARPLEAGKTFPLKTRIVRPIWVKNPPENLESLLGKFFLTKGALEQEGSFELEVVEDPKTLDPQKPQAVPAGKVVFYEERVGIARDNTLRAVKTGHLYAARHLRLCQEASLLVGLDKPLCPSHLDPQGCLQLGGEGRLVIYQKLESEIRLPGRHRGCFLALAPLSYKRAEKAGLLKGPYASGKLLRVAGFDLRRGFHKPVKTYFPAGTVFFTDKDPGICELIPF